MAAPTAQTPVVFSGAPTALEFMGEGNALLEVPMVKGELKITAEKGEATSSMSVAGGIVFREYGRGPTGFTFNWDSNWRVGMNPTPTEFDVGATYDCFVYFRKRGWNGVADNGGFYNFYLFMDEVSLTFDPRSGVFEWRASGTGNGYYTVVP